jgi:hypothetical protein
VPGGGLPAGCGPAAGVCAQPLMPGVNPVTFPTDSLHALIDVETSSGDTASTPPVAGSAHNPDRDHDQHRQAAHDCPPLSRLHESRQEAVNATAASGVATRKLKLSSRYSRTASASCASYPIDRS